MPTMRSLLESIDSLSEVQDLDSPPEKEAAFKELGLDEHQRDVFSLTWDYCQGQRSAQMDPLKQKENHPDAAPVYNSLINRGL